MWPFTLYSWRPQLWLLSWWAGAATATAYRLPMTLVPLAPHRLRTQLLSLHVSTLKPSPRAGLTRPSAWLRPPLRVVKPDYEAS